jgi:hypothetical protein
MFQTGAETIEYAPESKPARKREEAECRKK